MTLIKDIVNYTDIIAPLSTQAQWDNSGLLVGDSDNEVTKALLCLDITKSVVNEAKSLGCELIISHHPVIFSPLKSIDSDNVLYHLVKNDIAALCLHTNLDIAKDIGVNECLAKVLNLNDTTLYPDDFLCIGTLENSMTDSQFAKYVKQCLNCNGVRFTNGKDIKTVAVCSGAGSNAVELKNKYNFDALVTGELKHHHFLYASEHSLCAVEAGHFNTEDVVVNPLLSDLSSQFKDVVFTKSQSLCDVVNFI